MITAQILKLVFISLVMLSFFGCKNYNDQKLISIDNNITMQKPKPDFFSINDSNQNKIIFAPNYNKEWFNLLDKKYSWDKFDIYDNRFYEYMYNLFDTLPALAKGKSINNRDFFNKLTRGQKVFYSVLVFGGDTDKGGVYQFFFNKPEFSFAVLESFKELKLDKLSKDYENCLNEFIGCNDSYTKRNTVFSESANSWEKRFKAFSVGYDDFKSGKKIEAYYYKDNFKKQLFKTVVEYVDKNLDLFVKK